MKKLVTLLLLLVFVLTVSSCKEKVDFSEPTDLFDFGSPSLKRSVNISKHSSFVNTFFKLFSDFFAFLFAPLYMVFPAFFNHKIPLHSCRKNRQHRQDQ